MHVHEKILLDINGLREHGPINIVILGDSVSHGSVNGYMDYENVYWNVLKKKLNAFRGYMPVNMINASIGGTRAIHALERMEKHVFGHSPDLVIVCFGLNDVNGSLEEFLEALNVIFERCKQAGCDTIFMTPNMLNTYVCDDTAEIYREYAFKTADIQNSGRMDRYMYAAIDLAKSMEIPVCDCYSKWKALAETEDTTMLLANRINHPLPEMHKLFADALYDMIMGTQQNEAKDECTMYQGN